jgi:2'-5' RNA ligase
MRLFIAVNFNDEIKGQIMGVQDQLRAQSLRGNFTRPENFHITLAFLGETPEERLKNLLRIFEKIKAPPFEISFDHTGFFSHSGKEPWWIGAERNSPAVQTLAAIRTQLIDHLFDAGFDVDKRPFNAHITLGREIKLSKPVILDCPKIIIGVKRVSLMKSERIRGILTYTELSGRELLFPLE